MVTKDCVFLGYIKKIIEQTSQIFPPWNATINNPPAGPSAISISFYSAIRRVSQDNCNSLLKLDAFRSILLRSQNFSITKER